MISFTCACCGKQIDGLSDLAYSAPIYYDSLPEEDRCRRATLDSDFCVIDGENRFIRAVCPIPVAGTEAYFAWGVWVSLSEANFHRYAASFREGHQSKLGSMFGWFSNRLPVYPDTLNLPTTVAPQDGNQRPLVWIGEDRADHPLYIQQRNGISPETLGEIYAATICANKQN